MDAEGTGRGTRLRRTTRGGAGTVAALVLLLVLVVFVLGLVRGWWGWPSFVP